MGTIAVQFLRHVVGTSAVHLVTCVVASWVIDAALLETYPVGSTAVPQVRCVVGADAVLLGKCVACTSQINAVLWDTFFVVPTVAHLMSNVVGSIAVHLGRHVVVIAVVQLVTCVVGYWATVAALLGNRYVGTTVVRPQSSVVGTAAVQQETCVAGAAAAHLKKLVLSLRFSAECRQKWGRGRNSGSGKTQIGQLNSTLVNAHADQQEVLILGKVGEYGFLFGEEVPNFHVMILVLHACHDCWSNKSTQKLVFARSLLKSSESKSPFTCNSEWCVCVRGMRA